MALFLIERNFAQALNPTAADIKAVGEVNAQAGVKWLYSFLSADRRKTYCLYEAETAEAIGRRRGSLACRPTSSSSSPASSDPKRSWPNGRLLEALRVHGRALGRQRR